MDRTDEDGGLMPLRFLVACVVPAAAIAGTGIGGAWTGFGVAV